MKLELFKKLVLVCILFINSTIIQAQNPQTINGSISLTEETLNALVVQHGQNLLTSGIVFELWEVQYRDVLVKSTTGAMVPNTRVYLNKKQTSAIVSSVVNNTSDNKGINFVVNNIPANGNFILLYYFNSYPSQFKLFKPGSILNDGSNRNVQYATNALTKIGNNKKYGALSIIKKNAVVNYVTKVAANTTGVEAAFFGFGDILDFLLDAVDVVFEGGKILAGVVVDAAGAIIVNAYGGIQLLITDGTYPKYREITDAEYAWANTKMFNNSLPPKHRIIITNLKGVGNREFVWPAGAVAGGQILMNLGVVGYDNPMNMHVAQGRKMGAVFMHELTHVWQIHKTADISFVLSATKDQCALGLTIIDGKELYGFICGQPWNNYKIEQQATAVEKCFINRENKRTDCEEAYIVANIRNNTPFPIIRTPECEALVTNIAQVNKAIDDRITQLKYESLKDEGESTIRNSDGSFKVGTDKGLAKVSISPTKINNDPKIKELRAQLNTLNQRKITINCQ
jgi:hypothetical protein